MTTAAAASVGVALMLAGSASPASAFASIQAPSGPSCDSSRAQLVVAAPKVWAVYNTPEQVVWQSTIQRYNSANGTWYNYAVYTNYASFTNQGWSATSWSTRNTVQGGMYLNTMRYQVWHAGYYRVHSYISGNQSNLYWSALVSNGQYCYIN